MSLRTRPAAISCDRPIGPSPPLLLTIVSSRAPWSSKAQTSSVGMPAMPNPPMRMVAPSWTSASASATEPITLSSMASYGGWCDGRPSRSIAERARAALAQRRGQVRELGDEGAGLGRIDDVLDHECLGTAKRRSQRAHPLLFLRTLGVPVGRGFDIRLVGDLETAFDR